MDQKASTGVLNVELTSYLICLQESCLVLLIYMDSLTAWVSCSTFEAELADVIPVVKTSIAGTRIIGRLCAGENSELFPCPRIRYPLLLPTLVNASVLFWQETKMGFLCLTPPLIKVSLMRYWKQEENIIAAFIV